MKRPLTLSLTFSALSILASCASVPSDSSQEINDTNLSSSSRELSSTCGTVIDNKLENPVNGGEGEAVQIQAVAPDVFIITRIDGDQAGNKQIVKLQSVTSNGINSASREFGMQLIDEVLGGEAMFVPAGKDCVAGTQAGQGVFGHIYSLAGESISELLLEAGAVKATADACGGELLLSCYQSIKPQTSDETISKFLWKPISDTNGNLVVLIDPFDATIVVHGALTETLRDKGPGNGFGTQSRGNRPGCNYGANIRVEFFDFRGLRMKTASGEDSITVANGCSRTERTF